MAKSAFVDSATGVLKCWGFVESNEPGDTRIPVPEDFALDPRAGWQWDGFTWQKYSIPVVKSDRENAIEELQQLNEKSATTEDVIKLLRRAL
ncbi:MAG: hypothetical protein A2W35_17935 [Chloroflexi bacterium RBG_16_57_11]|nr:MAG: hypothetical protein A2W35_17935 [Chloroflexi bacterium RBG_16_57_11]